MEINIKKNNIFIINKLIFIFLLKLKIYYKYNNKII